jgi:hypothetical protein
MSAEENLSPQQFFHGTTQAGLKHVKPAVKHGGAVVHPETDKSFAYATNDEATAWAYADDAYHRADGNSGPPRVYSVVPQGAHEKDPSHDDAGRSRGNFEGDIRSQKGFRVLKELEMPDDMGMRKDWG